LSHPVIADDISAMRSTIVEKNDIITVGTEPNVDGANDVSNANSKEESEGRVHFVTTKGLLAKKTLGRSNSSAALTPTTSELKNLNSKIPLQLGNVSFIYHYVDLHYL